MSRMRLRGLGAVDRYVDTRIVDDDLHGVTVHDAHDFGGLRRLVVALAELEQQDEDEDQQRHGGDAGTAEVAEVQLLVTGSGARRRA